MFRRIESQASLRKHHANMQKAKTPASLLEAMLLSVSVKLAARAFLLAVFISLITLLPKFVSDAVLLPDLIVKV